MRLSQHILALMVILPLITNCSEVQTKDITARLNTKLLSNYNLLRWNNFRPISLTQTEKYKQIPVDYAFLKKIKVSQVHQTGMQLSEENTRADVFYALEFYDTDTNKIHAATYHQEWVIEAEYNRTWKLNSPLPDFKAILDASRKAREPKIKIIEY